jgi:hypothetical protein
MGKVSQIKINGVMYDINDDRIFIGTTKEWSDASYIPRKNDIYIYSDANEIEGTKYPSLKVADGKAYLVDLPFIGDDSSKIIFDHINDSNAHVSEKDREFWNNKVSCHIEEFDNDNVLIFSID